MDSVNSYLVSGLYRVITDRLKKQKPITQPKDLITGNRFLQMGHYYPNSIFLSIKMINEKAPVSGGFPFCQAYLKRTSNDA